MQDQEIPLGHGPSPHAQSKFATKAPAFVCSKLNAAQVDTYYGGGGGGSATRKDVRSVVRPQLGGAPSTPEIVAP